MEVTFNMDESELSKQLYAFIKEGAHARIDGISCPYPPRTVAAMLHSVGWVREDLRQALIKADPRYGEEQRRFEAAGVFK